MPMKKILDAIQIHKKKFSFDFCDNIKKYADIVCKQKGQTIKPEDDLSREVLVYGLADNKQDNLYKSFIFSNISNVLKQYIKTFKMITNCEISDVNLLKYPEGHYYKPHVDYSLSTPRNLSVIINLNDDYVGGELYFTSQDMQDIYKIYELKKGDTVIFPSNFLFPHGIMPMVQGTRYSIITWIK
jgi:Rps23 Pro-64 3,4-dihydroxylase Tpa1-like proline 4-hydroxylase